MNSLTRYKQSEVNCALCGINDTCSVGDERGFTIVRCRKCGLVYVNPRLSEDEYERVTNLTYQELVEESLSDKKTRMPLRKITINRDKYILSRLNSAKKDFIAIRKFYSRKISLLDVGCGEGFFIKVVSDAGYDAVGIEFSSKHLPPKEFKIKVIQGDFLKNYFPPGFYNLVTLWDVLEHMQDPNAVLSKVRSILEKDGLLIIRVPNERYLRLKAIIVNLFLKQNFYLQNRNFSILGLWAPETHFYNFSESTLTKLLAKHGFGVIRVALGKAAMGEAKLRALAHTTWHFLAIVVYFLTFKKLNCNCSITIYARAI